MGHNRNLADYAHHFDGTHIDLGSGNIETEGVVTYEDVTNVDAIGIVTARAGVKVPDTQKIFLGTGDDFAITHDGTNTTFINDTGQIQIRNRADDQDIILQTDDGSGGVAVYLRCDGSSGQVDLNHYGSRKFYTSSTGATVNGTLVSDGVTSELDLSAISSSISDTAVDIFVYDTRKDSDGGAWRKRTQHTSWYNETLNTSTRGSRKEFPAVAVIVAESNPNKVTIYDGDDPDLPMWMVFNASTNTNANFLAVAGQTLSSIFMLNGELGIGFPSGNQWGLNRVNFLSDSQGWYWTSATIFRQIKNSIAERNLQNGYYDSGSGISALTNARVNDIAMTVLPNAPIDDATGLPVPTIALATHGSLSIIKDDGNVIEATSASGSLYSYVKALTITEENYLWFLADYFNGYTNLRDSYALSLDTLPSGNFTWNNSTDNLSTGRFYALTTGNEGGEIKIGSVNTWAWNRQERNALGGPLGLAIHKPNIGSENNSLFALITSDYNSGYMHGDCRGAFLADTDTTNKTNGQTDPDRSKYNYALSVTGTINKSAVATGADLVSYHGFTSSNYLRHTNGINYGNGATITMGGWSKIPGSAVDSNYRYLCSVKSGAEVLGLAIHIDNGSYGGKPYFYDVTNSSLQSDGPRVDDNEWHHIIGVLDGTSKKIYIDGELITSATVTGINLSSVNITNVGHYVPGNNNTPNYNHEGYLALIKFSGSAPTAEQVKKMYEEEKVLFQENAKCTLYGSSDAVTGLAYDDSTELYHVGTSAGRSDFQGLRRINNTTTAVTTAISASDELIAEQ